VFTPAETPAVHNRTASSPTGPPTGVVLAGGQSSRLGLDKAGLRLSGSGSDLLTRSAMLLRDLGLPVLVVGREHPDFPWVSDDLPNHGPLGGVVTALRHSRGACLALSCDLPFMDKTTLERLIAGREQRPDKCLWTAFSHTETGQTEYLPAIYEYALLDLLEEKLQRRLLKMAKLLPEERLHKIPCVFEEALPFFNINYPADLILARNYLELTTRR